jgi:hypothetical protein
MLKRLSAAAASIAVVAFLFVSIAHACSGIAPVTLALQQSPMNMGGDNSSPCSRERGDICQWVRDSILSDKPSISVSADAIQSIVALQPAIGSPPDLVLSTVSCLVGISFQPIFKPPLTVSFTVFRI